MWRCMIIIENNKGCNLKDIAKGIKCRWCNYNKKYKKLEDLNYVIKVKRDNDNRFFDLCLTDKGLDILKLINEYHDKWYEKITYNFNEEEVSNLINLLNKLCSNI